jgi:NADH:ubiquinone oxidoreductase subunit E
MIQLTVCIGSACHLKGAYNVISTFQHLIEANNLHDKVEFSAAFCRKSCNKPGVSVTLNAAAHNIPAEDARTFFLQQVLPLAEQA